MLYLAYMFEVHCSFKAFCVGCCGIKRYGGSLYGLSGQSITKPKSCICTQPQGSCGLTMSDLPIDPNPDVVNVLCRDDL